MFLFRKKQKPTEENLTEEKEESPTKENLTEEKKESLTKELKKTDIIPIIIEEERKNNIMLGKKNDTIFIAFKDKEINEFLKIWFPILKMKINNEVSEKYYEAFINSVLIEFGTQEIITENYNKQKPDFDDLINETEDVQDDFPLEKIEL